MWEVASKICSEARESPESPEGRKVGSLEQPPEPSNLHKEIDSSAPEGPSPKPLLPVNLREVKWKKGLGWGFIGFNLSFTHTIFS